MSERDPLREWRGRLATIREISLETGISADAIRARLSLGWPLERAATEPLRQRGPARKGRPCVRCGGPLAVTRRGLCQECVSTRPRTDSLVSHTTPFWEDDAAIAFVLDHPGGADLADVGEMFGLSRERIRQIEEVALRKVRAAMQLRRIHGVGDLALADGERR